MIRLPFIGVTNLNNKLPPIITRLPFIRVTKYESSLGTDKLTGEIQVAQIKRPVTFCYEKELQ